MTLTCRFIAGLALASLLFAAPVAAQGPIEGEGSMQVGNATVSVGGGTAILDLPDVPSVMTQNMSGSPFSLLEAYKSSDDFGDEIGWNVNGSIEAPMGANRTVSLNGFWANIENDGSSICTVATSGNNCSITTLVDGNPAVLETSGTAVAGTQLSSVSDREVDHWGVSLEVKQQMNPTVMGVTQAPPRRYFAVGADIRGIDQDLNERITNTFLPASVTTYNEELDTRYYGGYAAWGGDFPRLVLGSLWERWGLHSTFQLRGGVYYADTDYEGRLISPAIVGVTTATSALSLSSDDVAFIGGLVMETRKRIGQRATLSLRSEYEYYSYVPEMAYNRVDIGSGGVVLGTGGQDGTSIGDDDAFSMRTSLRLTIKLGPDSVFEEPLK